MTGFLYLDLVLWGLGSYLIKNCDQPATWVASCPSTALMTGRALGIVVGILIASEIVRLFFWAEVRRRRLLRRQGPPSAPTGGGGN